MLLHSDTIESHGAFVDARFSFLVEVGAVTNDDHLTPGKRPPLRNTLRDGLITNLLHTDRCPNSLLYAANALSRHIEEEA